jgi:hypothetical protein
VYVVSFTYVFREEEMTEGDLGKKHNPGANPRSYTCISVGVCTEFTEVVWRRRDDERREEKMDGGSKHN